MLSVGTKGHKVMNSWDLDEATKVSANVFKIFENHLVGTVNKWVMRLELVALTQKDGESVDDFVCRLKAKVNQCKSGEASHRDEQVVFQLIKGILWPEARNKLIVCGNDLKLAKAVDCPLSYEATLQSTSSFASTASINAARALHRECNSCTYKHPQVGAQHMAKSARSVVVAMTSVRARCVGANRGRLSQHSESSGVSQGVSRGSASQLKGQPGQRPRGPGKPRHKAVHEVVTDPPGGRSRLWLLGD